MADVKLYKGGTPLVKYMWCDCTLVEFDAPFAYPNNQGTAPYDSHADGAYAGGIGYFTIGTPIRPRLMTWQRDALRCNEVAVDDILQTVWIPVDHYATYVNFKSLDTDERMAGATVTLTVQEVTRNEDGVYVYEEVADMEDALAAQDLGDPIPLDAPFNVMVSLLRVVSAPSLTGSATPSLTVTGTANLDTGVVTGTATGNVSSAIAGTTLGYVRPLYSDPGKVYMLGVKVLSLPTDTNVGLADSVSGWYQSTKIEGFESPSQM